MNTSSQLITARFGCVATLMVGICLAAQPATIAAVVKTPALQNQSNPQMPVVLTLPVPRSQVSLALNAAFKPPDNGGPTTSGGSGTRYRACKSTAESYR